MDMMNECFIAILLYHIICFADFIKEDETRNIVGYSMIVVLMLNIAINFATVLTDAIKQLYQSCRKRYLRKKYKRLQAKFANDESER